MDLEEPLRFRESRDIQFRDLRMPQTKHKAELLSQITDRFLRVLNEIHLGRRIPRDFGGKRKLTLIEAEMCVLIARQNGITGSQISRELGVTRSATSQYVAKLRKNGCVEMRADPTNAKIKKVHLTDEGRRTANLALRYRKMMARSLDSSEQELRHYLQFVTRLDAFHKQALTKLTSVGPNRSRNPGDFAA